MFLDNFRNILYLYHGVKAGIRINNHNRAQCAQAVTAGLNNGNLIFQTCFFNLFFQGFHNLLASGGSTSCSAADQYM